MLKKNTVQFGILLGFTAPVLGLVIYYFITFYTRNVGFMEFLGYLRQYKTLLTGVSSIALVANAVLFTFYINSRRDDTAKGIFVATVIYGVAILLIKMIR